MLGLAPVLDLQLTISCKASLMFQWVSLQLWGAGTLCVYAEQRGNPSSTQFIFLLP